MKKLLFFLIAGLLVPVRGVAQDKPKAYIATDLVTHYMWRGQNLGNVCLQPTAAVMWKGFRLSAEGSVGFSHEDYEEIDLHLDYNYKGFGIGLADFWGEDTGDPRYFRYGNSSGHMIEANIGYECQYGSLFVYTTFAGNDFKINGKRAYSTFIELAVPFRAFELDWDLKVGITPFESSGAQWVEDTINEQGNEETIVHNEYFYAKNFNCNMLSLRATKTFEFSKFNLPVFVEFHANPAAEDARLFVGFTISSQK